MEYQTSKETAALWGIGKCRVDRLAREGRIDGAVLFGKSWMIPKNAPKPIDGRTRQAKNTTDEAFFRFPLLVNTPENGFSPSLTEEEVQLRTAQIDFFACRFEEAKQSFSELSQKAKSIYVRICAITFMGILSACYDSNIDWSLYYHELNLCFEPDFPHKEEMHIFLPWLDYFCGLFESVAESIHFDPEYDYSPTANYLNAFLSVFQLMSIGSVDNHSSVSLTQYEILCQTMHHEGHFLQEQELHRMLFTSYYMSQDKSLMNHHLKQLLSIALEHDLIYEAADITSYFPDAFQKVAEDFPEDFVQKISQYSDLIQKNYAVFTEKNNITNVYCSLEKSDYKIMFFVMQGYSNKQIAEAMHYSAQTISNKLSEIYDKLGINSRKDIITLFHESMSKKLS